MKYSSLLALFILAISSTRACDEYTNCWCEVANTKSETGKPFGDYRPDNGVTDRACIEIGGAMVNAGTKSRDPKKNSFHRECHVPYTGTTKFWGIPLWQGTAISNCAWNDVCYEKGGAKKKGFCRNKAHKGAFGY